MIKEIQQKVTNTKLDRDITKFLTKLTIQHFKLKVEEAISKKSHDSTKKIKRIIAEIRSNPNNLEENKKKYNEIFSFHNTKKSSGVSDKHN